MATRQPYPKSPPSTNLPNEGTHILSFNRPPSEYETDRKQSFDATSQLSAPYPPSKFFPPPHKPSTSTSNFSFVLTDDGTDRHPNSNGSGWTPSPQASKEDKRSTFFQSVFPKSLACRLYLIIVLIETLLDLVIEGSILSQVNDAIEQRQHKHSSENSHVLVKNQIPVYLGIFFMAHILQFGLALDAVYHRNTLQFGFLAIFNALFFAYSVIQIFEVRNLVTTGSSGFIPISALTITIPVVVALAQIAYIALGWKIYGEFGWSVYKLIGADRRVKRMYAQYQIFECLVRFDIIFWLGFSVQLVALVLQKGDFEFYVTIAALPFSLILLFVGHMAARHENRWMMSSFIVGCVAALVYFCYKFYRIWTQRFTPTFMDVYKSLSIFSCASIALLVITFIWSIIVFRNFGNGLKQHMSKKGSSGQDVEMGSGVRKDIKRNRMSIE